MKATFRLAIFFCILLSSQLQAQNIGQLRSNVQSATNDTLKLNSAKQLFAQYVYSKVDSAIYFAEKVVELGESLSMPMQVSSGIQYLGIAYAIKGDYLKAGEYMKQNLAYYEELGDSLNMAYTLNNLGLNYLYAEEWLLSSENFLRAIRIKEALIQGGSSTSSDADLTSSLINLAITYDNQSDTTNAERYFTLALDEAAAVKDTVNAARAKNGLGNISLTKGSYEQALFYFREIEPVFVGMNDLYSLGKLYNNLALSYAELGNYQQTLTYAQKAIDTNIEIGNRQSEGLGLMYLGLGYERLGRHNEAIRTSRSALEIGLELDSKSIISGSYKNLYEAYEGLGNYEKAFEHSLLYHEVDKALYSIERAEQIEELSARYEADKRESQIEQLSQEKQLQALMLSKANSERNLFLVLLISAVLFILLAFYFYRKIAQSRAQLSVKNLELEKLNNTKDRFFAIISHDLRGYISSFQGTGRLLRYFMAKKDEAKLEAVSSEIDKNANNLSHLLDNLLQWSLDQLHGYELKPEAIEVKAVVRELSEAFQPLINAKGLEIKIDVGATHIVKADRGSLFVILRNLIANAVKFTESGSIHIFSKKEGAELVLGVRDTGIGIPAEMRDQLFEINENKIRRGTQNEKGTGLGLNLVFEFTKMNGGRIELESKEGLGTTFLIYLAHG